LKVPKLRRQIIERYRRREASVEEALIKMCLAGVSVRRVAKLRDLRLTKAAELVEIGVAETLAYYSFPEANWRRIRTNNPLERILREDPPAIARGRPVPRRAIGVEPCRGAATLHRRQRMVDQEVPAHGAAEGPAD
jgi:transposase-like protein